MRNLLVLGALVILGCGKEEGGGMGTTDRRDTDGDGRVTTADGMPCVGCTVLCISFDGRTSRQECLAGGRNIATREGTERWGTIGFACSSSSDPDDHEGFTVICDAACASPRCVRIEGEPLATDLSAPVCKVVEEPELPDAGPLTCM